MKIKIYQVNTERDEKNVAFFGLDEFPKFHGNSEVNSSIYDCVFEGNVDCKTLEDVFQKFNTDHPEGYKARSLSVSDVVEVTGSDTVKQGFHFCDSYGFKEISFDPTKAQISDRFLESQSDGKITVLLVEPGKYPKFIKIDDTLEAMQEVVGGYIEEYMPYEDEVAIICNEEGKYAGMPLNRAIYSEAPNIEMTYQEMARRFCEVEKSREKSVDGYIVFTEDSFSQPYTEQQRTYVVSSNNKAYIPGMGGFSVYGSSLDGSDTNVRLERYMADLHGGKDGWKVERCYMKDDSQREMLDIIAGKFFVCHAPFESENFQSLPKDLAFKYEKLFKYPEKFVRTDEGIKAIPYKPKLKDMER